MTMSNRGVRGLRVVVLSAACLAVFCGQSTAVKLPSYFGKPCSRSAPEEELSACAQNAANMGISAFTNGDKKLRISNLNPLIVPRVSISQGSGQINLNLTWAPLEIHGLRDAQISNMKMSWKKHTCELDFLFPTFTMAGPYKAKGRILLLPITGAGPSNFTFTNIRLRYNYDWPVHKGYVTVVNSKIRIVGADALKSELNGLFNGDKLLGEQMNNFLNENWRDVLKELGPSMVDAAREVIEAVVKNLTDNVPIDELFAP